MFIVFWVNVFHEYAGDGSYAPSPIGLNVYGSPVPLGSTATHDPMGWAVEASPLGEVEVPRDDPKQP